VGEIDYDASLTTAGSASPAQINEYRRAKGACLDARGYAAKSFYKGGFS
jgi:hypothetical protein